MKYCIKCGAQINDSADFCKMCGAKQDCEEPKTNESKIELLENNFNDSDRDIKRNENKINIPVIVVLAAILLIGASGLLIVKNGKINNIETEEYITTTDNQIGNDKLISQKQKTSNSIVAHTAEEVTKKNKETSKINNIETEEHITTTDNQIGNDKLISQEQKTSNNMIVHAAEEATERYKEAEDKETDAAITAEIADNTDITNSNYKGDEFEGSWMTWNAESIEIKKTDDAYIVRCENRYGENGFEYYEFQCARENDKLIYDGGSGYFLISNDYNEALNASSENGAYVVLASKDYPFSEENPPFLAWVRIPKNASYLSRDDFSCAMLKSDLIDCGDHYEVKARVWLGSIDENLPESAYHETTILISKNCKVYQYVYTSRGFEKVEKDLNWWMANGPLFMGEIQRDLAGNIIAFSDAGF